MNYNYINTEYLDSVSDGYVEIMAELVSMFRDQVAETVIAMKSLLDKKDYYSLGLLAHKAKSSVLIMGMNNLGALLKTFELQAKEGTESDKYESYISIFSHDTGEAVKELDDVVNNRLTNK